MIPERDSDTSNRVETSSFDRGVEWWLAEFSQLEKCSSRDRNNERLEDAIRRRYQKYILYFRIVRAFRILPRFVWFLCLFRIFKYFFNP